MPILRQQPHLSQRSSWNKLFQYCLIIFFLLFSSSTNIPAQSDARPEYALKAVFLFNFAQFVDWPASAFADSQKPLVIGVLGNDPFGKYLDETIAGEKVNNRSLAVQRYQHIEDVDTCHILFICESEKGEINDIVAGLNGRSILTVSDIEGGAKAGIMIRFITEKKKVRLKINVEAAKSASLSISSKLLRLAEIVETEKK
jgi:hypothetical protein